MDKSFEEFEKIILNKKYETTEKMKLLAGDASSRLYWRWSCSPQDTKIICVYPEKDDLTASSFQRFINWQKFYIENGFNVPKIHYVDEKIQLMVMDDLGKNSLLEYLTNQSEELELEMMKKAIDQIIKLGQFQIDKKEFVHLPKFNLEKLQFEIGHTITYFYQNYLEVNNHDILNEMRSEWALFLDPLTHGPWKLSHRDFHSRNIMIKRDTLGLIDFQDTMLGLEVYDLCSLLDDCYRRVTPAVYHQCLVYYWDQVSLVKKSTHFSSFYEFMYFYQRMKIQRQFKAIGSFAYVWKKRNNPRYLKYISYVMESIKTSFATMSGKETKKLERLLFENYYAN